MGNMLQRHWSVWILLGLLAGCGKPPASDPVDTSGRSGKHLVFCVCTTGMVADVVRNVGGDAVQVQYLMGDRVDPHLYKASPGDVNLLQKADAIFYSGLHLEGKLNDVLDRLKKRKLVLGIADELPKERLLDDGGAFHDPHVWFDVDLWSQTVGAVENSLVKLRPDHAESFRKNAATYRTQLAELHAQCREKLSRLPKERRIIVTAHDAFHYLGRAYDVEVKAIQGISTETEAGVKQINELVQFLSDRKIPAVFIETTVSDRNVQSLIEGCQNSGHAVRLGGELFSDAMGAEGTPEGTYIGMVRHNVDVIVKALGGDK